MSWIKSGKISNGYVIQLNQKTNKSPNCKKFHIFSLDMAKIPRIRPMPLKIKALRKKIIKTKTIVAIDKG